MPPFKYSVLPPGDDRTRLLRLLPNEDSTAPIKCELLDYSLQKSRNGAHMYDALSYVWGTSAKSQSIYIEDGEFEVSQNLHSALRRLRDPAFERILWVDAICIKQDDDAEKERQIQAMGKIYAQANQVVVWLGDEVDNSSEAIETIREKAAGSYGILGNISINDAAFNKLCERPWFRRIWVVQEVGLARNIRVLCGPAEINGHIVGLALKRDRNPAVRAMADNMGQAVFRPQHGTYPLKQLSLGELIDTYHTHEASLRHDKIYALLGMSSDGLSAKGLLPNYKVPWEELFKRLMEHVLSARVSVRIGQDKDTAVIQAKGWVLGIIHTVERDEWNHQKLSMFLTGDCVGKTKTQNTDWETKLTVPDSAKDIRRGDIFCILQEATDPIIIRHFQYYFEIILLRTNCPPSIWSKVFPSGYKRDREDRYARNFCLVWSWKLSSTNIDSLVSTPSGAIPGIDQMLWDANLILHDTADGPRSAKHVAIEHIAEMLKIFAQRLGHEHSKTRLAVYGLGLLSAGAAVRSRLGMKLDNVFRYWDLKRKVGSRFYVWRYLDDELFAAGNLSAPSLAREKIETVLEAANQRDCYF
ncbi:heterokaryon incompatibility protein-domain-containing protein [Aspergillus bertholletiae]|uniref:Heterokaryon incompatibility protein-domain-containing protein n=1 Tax=Aspergillus bertholletiae TaxID=1226010 RepID=A0A5N7AYL4_9EURO|nr:heterokaryon incompatibility protein-domain-containing protein [Aspergillus bertholletiae]